MRLPKRFNTKTTNRYSVLKDAEHNRYKTYYCITYYSHIKQVTVQKPIPVSRFQAIRNNKLSLRYHLLSNIQLINLSKLNKQIKIKYNDFSE